MFHSDNSACKMYHFVKGPASRLAVVGTREGGDRDNVADGSSHIVSVDRDDDLTAVYTRRMLSTEVRGSSSESSRTMKHGGTRSVVTRVLKHTTMVTRGEERSVNEDLLSRPQHHRLVQPPTRVVLEASVQYAPLTSSAFKVVVPKHKHAKVCKLIEDYRNDISLLSYCKIIMEHLFIYI